jgi:hypothetical protein
MFLLLLVTKPPYKHCLHATQQGKMNALQRFHGKAFNSDHTGNSQMPHCYRKN